LADAMSAPHARTYLYVALLAVISPVSLCKEYPATYPFDVLDLPVGAPSYTYDDADPGGYMNLALECDWDDFAEIIADKVFVPFGTHGCKTYSFFLTVNGFNPLAGNMAPDFFNCSTKGQEVTAEYLSERNVECSYIQGAKVWYYSDMIETKLNDVETNYFCDSPDEMTVCSMVYRSTAWCYDIYLTAGSRLYTNACLDVVQTWLHTCNLFQNVPNINNSEPDSYWDSLTADQSVVALALGYCLIDRVCYPYSYFHPADDAVPDTSDDTPAEDGDSGSTTADESSAIRRLSGVFL